MELVVQISSRLGTHVVKGLKEEEKSQARIVSEDLCWSREAGVSEREEGRRKGGKKGNGRARAITPVLMNSPIWGRSDTKISARSCCSLLGTSTHKSR